MPLVILDEVYTHPPSLGSDMEAWSQIVIRAKKPRDKLLAVTRKKIVPLGTVSPLLQGVNFPTLEKEN